jgi:hypothetical protein
MTSHAPRHGGRKISFYSPKVLRRTSCRLSDNRVLVELIEEGIEARRQKEKAFFDLAEKFRAAEEPEQGKRIGQLGRFVFGE